MNLKMIKKKRAGTGIAAALVLLLCLSACGSKATEEEPVETTTVEVSITDAEESDISPYEEIYDEYAQKLETKADGYAKELKSKADGMSNGDLYDLVREKTDTLDKIRKEGADKLTDTTLASKEDDVKKYQKYFNKLTEKYSDESKKLTEVYTDRF